MNPDDESEFEELLQRVYRYALSLCHDRRVAEELVQEGCRRVAKRGGRWELPGLMRVVRDGFAGRRGRGGIGAVRPDESESGEGARDVADELGWALGRLGAEEREALYLSAVEGRSVLEIARLTGRPRGEALSLLARVKERVRGMLESRGVSL